MDGRWEGETVRVAALTDEEVEAEAAIDREEASAVQRGAGAAEDDGGSGAAQQRRRGGMRLGHFLSVLSPAQLEAAGGAVGGGSKGAKPLNEDLLAAQAQLFFLAGSDTTACALSYLLYCLAQHPAAQSEVQAELDAWQQADAPTATQLRDGFPKLNAAISEALRLYPSLPAPGRVGDCAVTLGGLAVPAGTPLRVSTYALHRSTRVWGPDAAEFRLERWAPGGQGEAVEKAGGYVPFGGGPRRCPGYKFALQLVRLTAWQLLRCFRLELLPGQEELHTSSGVTMAPTHGVHVRLHPRMYQSDWGR